jgi:uncharacterized protein (TIGR02145 family)
MVNKTRKMKKFTLTLANILIGIICVLAQPPKAFNYQTVVRNSSGELITNQPVSFRIGILQDSINGILVYSESHIQSANQFGLVSFEVGNGTVESGIFKSIKWGTAYHFLKVELDETGGANYQLMGISQLLSVPYALNSSSLSMADTNGLIWDFYVNPFGQLILLAQDPGDIGCGTELVDVRDGQIYPIVQIGFQCWIAKNLNIGTMISGSSNQINNGIIEKYCYNNSTSNCNVYGGLYQWNEIMNYTTQEKTQGICPEGWHIPSDYEFNVLYGYLGDNPGGKFKESGTTYWNTPNTGATNETGFTALPGGILNGDNKNYLYLGSNTLFWTSTQTPYSSAWQWMLSYNYASFSHYGNYSLNYGLSLRCLKD